MIRRLQRILMALFVLFLILEYAGTYSSDGGAEQFAGFGVMEKLACAKAIEAKTQVIKSVKINFFMCWICLKLAGVRK